jgi:rhamnosyltransferase
MNPIVIGIVGTRGIPNNYGGFERFVELLVADFYWKDFGIAFIVYGEGPSIDLNPWTKIKCVGLSKNKTPFLYYWRSTSYSAKECDIVLSCGVGISLASFLPIINGKALIVNPDGCEWRRTKWNFFGRIIIKLMYWPALLCARKIVIDAESLRSDFNKVFSNKFEYIPYQSPEPHEGYLSKIDTERLLLFKPFMLVIARIEPENNILLIIKAFLQLNAINIDLVIIGGLNTDYYKKMLSTNLFNKIRFLGPIYDQAILDGLRSQCIAYIHGHTVGGTNPSLLEALSTVKGSIFCHCNKYNLEVAKSEASYFTSESELIFLMQNLVRNFNDSTLKKRIPSQDMRFKSRAISEKYLNLFRRVYASR